jgi:phosphoglycerate dehydrogenase-like enzyme
VTVVEQQSQKHRAVLGRPDPVLAANERPTSGPVAVLPEPEQVFVDAIRAAGVEVGPFSSETRGVMWLSGARADELVTLLEENPQVEWVQLPSAGVDPFAKAIAATADKTFPLWTSAKGAYAQPVAEHALVLALSLLRVIPKRVLATSWEKVPEGKSLYGREVVVIGAGGIAIELMRLMEPFGVSVTIVRRSPEEVPGAARTVTSDRLLEVLPTADVVVVAAALTTGTHKLIGAEELAAMPTDAVLVNIARGGLVDTDALVAALASGGIAGAGLDVTDPEPLPDGHPLWNEPRCIITPHSADTPEMTDPLLAERVRHNAAALLGDGEFTGIVDRHSGY